MECNILTSPASSPGLAERSKWVIRDDTDEFLTEETQKVTFILRLTALFVAENRRASW